MRHRIFEFPDDQAHVLVPAIDVGIFPWERLVPGIQAQVGRDYIPTKLSDLSRYGVRAAGNGHSHGHSHDEGMHVLEVRHRVLGLFWTNYQVEVEQSLVNDPTLLAEVFWSEGAHAIDQAMLSDAQRAEIYNAFHPGGADQHPPWWEYSDYSAEYGQLVGESFMEAIVEAYTPLTATINLHHEVTPHVIDTVRRILTPEPEPVEPVYCGCKRSKVFHRCDAHWWSCVAETWSTREAAVAVRRPCRLCRP